MKKLLIAVLAVLIATPAVCLPQKKKITVVPAEAKIYVDGQYVADGSYVLQFNKKNDIYVIKVECPGYATKNFRVLRTNPHNTIVCTLNEDDSIAASIATDLANKYFTIRVREGMSVEQAWKLLTQTLLNYYDEIKTSDRSSGFMNTTWTYQPFPKAEVKVRTRVQIKEITNDGNLTYQIRISSEIADIDAGEQGFKAWGRVLKKYEPLINEMQMRLQ